MCGNASAQEMLIGDCSNKMEERLVFAQVKESAALSWECVYTKADKFNASNEKAEDIAKASVSACESQFNDLAVAMCRAVYSEQHKKANGDPILENVLNNTQFKEISVYKRKVVDTLVPYIIEKRISK